MIKVSAQTASDFYLYLQLWETLYLVSNLQYKQNNHHKIGVDIYERNKRYTYKTGRGYPKRR